MALSKVGRSYAQHFRPDGLLQSARSNRTQARRLVSYFHKCSPTPLSYESIGQSFRKQVESVPDKELCVFAHQNIRRSYAQVFTEARMLAGVLLELGLRPGDRIGVWGPNNYEWLVCWFANTMAGFVQVNINAFYKADELQHTLTNVGCRALVTPKQCGERLDYYSTLKQIHPGISKGTPGIGRTKCPALPQLEHIIVYGEQNQQPGAWSFEDIVTGVGTNGGHALRKVEQQVQPDHPASILYTSGTTGLPKAAVITHRGIVNGCYSLGNRSQFHLENQKMCVPTPLHHVLGAGVGTTMMALHGQTAVFPSATYDVNRILQVIAQEKCTAICGTPTIYIDMLRQLQKMPELDISSLHKGFIAGAPCSSSLVHRISTELNLPDLLMLYGATEMSIAVACSDPTEPRETRFGHVGHPLDHLELLHIDKKGNVVERGVKGELLVRGHAVMRGYYGDGRHEDMGHDRWHRTGDIAVMNGDGSIRIVDRVKDMIIRGGVNIYPSEIEQFLAKIDGVADAHVVGVPDERLGEELCAWIRPANGATHLTPELIRDECRTKSAHFKVPRYVLIKDESAFPRTAVGKILKRKLREMTASELQKQGKHANSLEDASKESITNYP